MSNSDDKIKNSKRRHRDDIAVDKQVRIAKQNNLDVEQPHKYSKRHVMNCGNPGCSLCANPRKIFNQPTIQEKKIFQDIDNIRDKKNNGFGYNEEN